MPQVMVTAVGREDIRELAELIRDMDRHYGDPVDYSVQQAVAAVQTHLIDCAGRGALIARTGPEAVGMVIYAAPWPTINLQAALFLKDIFVRAHARGLGVGRALLAHLSRLAIDEGYARIDWTTDRSNAIAQVVYRGLGVPIIEQKLFYRLEGERLLQMANGA